MNQINNGCLFPPKAAYVHIPFCVSKCHYCDFSSYSGMESAFDDYTRALIMEINATPSIGQPLETVYFGGGTPTLLSTDYLIQILSAISEHFCLSSSPEITFEANPGTVDELKLVQLRNGNFNRISLGVQSFDDEYLVKIGRIHTSAQAVNAYDSARKAGFSNVGIDLIFALPGQTLAHWEKTLDIAIELAPEHISLYELSIEEGTRFAELCAQGSLDLPDEDTQVDMYELTISKLTSAGLEHYEVSNFARPGFRSQHNQVYWRNEPYYGFGAGATSYVKGDRTRKLENPTEYINAVFTGADAIEFSEHLEGRALLAETIMQGLRMLDGIDMSKIKVNTITNIQQEFAEEISNLKARGLLEAVGNRMKVTHKGLLLLNDVAQEFVSAPE